MAVESNSHALSFSRLSTEEQHRQQEMYNGTFSRDLQKMYPARLSSYRHHESAGRSAGNVTLRSLAEGFLNLEQKMKMWRRQLHRKLGDIESRLTRCESSLLSTRKAVMKKSSVGEEEDTHIGVENAFRRLQTALTSLRATAVECSQGRQPCFDCLHKCEEIREEEEESTPHRVMYVGDNGGGRARGQKGMSPATDTTAVGSGESAGLTPDSTEKPSLRAGIHSRTSANSNFLLLHNSGHRGGQRWGEDTSYLHASPPQSQSSFPPTPSFLTMTPITQPVCSAAGSTCKHEWLSFIQEPCRPKREIIRPGKTPSADGPSSDLPHLRTEPTSRIRTRGAKLKEKEEEERREEVTESPPTGTISLERELIYSPVISKGIQTCPSLASFSRFGPSSSGVNCVGNLQEFTGTAFLTSNSLGNIKRQEKNASPSPRKAESCTNVSTVDSLPPDNNTNNSGVGDFVPFAQPFYFTPQQHYGGSSTDSSHTYDTEVRTAKKEEEKGRSHVSTNQEEFFETFPPKLSMGTVWQKMVALAHVEQQQDQLHKSLYPPFSMISSGILEVSASTA